MNNIITKIVFWTLYLGGLASMVHLFETEVSEAFTPISIVAHVMITMFFWMVAAILRKKMINRQIITIPVIKIEAIES